MKNKIENVLVGMDIGNGYLKGTAVISDEEGSIDVDYQSVVSLAIDPVSFGIDSDNKTEVEETVNDIFNCLDASFNTPLVSDRYRHIFGRQGIVHYPESVRQFDVTLNRIGKAKDELSSILCLGTIAGIALKNYYAKNGGLPTDDIDVTARIALALPIDEYIEERDAYPAKLCRCDRHTVEIHNFNVKQNTINVNVKFEDVAVLAEGSAAQIAIVSNGSVFIQNLLDQAKQMNSAWNAITADDIIMGDSTVGIDIGEGTVNYTVFADGTFSPKLSNTFMKGYGSVLDSAISAIRKESGARKHIYKNRKELNNFLSKEVTGTKKLQREVADTKIAEQKKIFAGEIVAHLSEVLSSVGSVDVVYVYGGGANAMRSDLYEKLIPVVAVANPLAPILYMEKDYCRTLNRDGLFSCALARSRKTDSEQE